jgi:glycosyltransferase involved in cell wall biosynthesis
MWQPARRETKAYGTNIVSQLMNGGGSPIGEGNGFKSAGVAVPETGALSEAERREHLRTKLREARWSLRQSGLGGVTKRQGFVTSNKSDYEEMILKLRDVVRESLPTDARVLVVSKGDPELLKLGGQVAGHFPQNADGVYTGYYPRDSADAIRSLEELRKEGADYLLFPGTAFWWLDHYREFRLHLEKNYPVVVRQEGVCAIFALHDRANVPGDENLRPETPDLEPEGSEETLRVELASTLTELGRISEAREILSEGMALCTNNCSLLIAAMQLALEAGDEEGAENFIQQAAEKWPNDCAVNMALARLAWHRRDLDQAERNLMHAVNALPEDAEALNELMKLFCSRLENPEPYLDSSLVKRFLAQLEDTERHRWIAPEVHLRIAETLGSTNLAHVQRVALASLRSALSSLDLNCESLQTFLFRIVRSVVADRSAVPLQDRRSLSAFLTHVGNGFNAVHDSFKAETCYHLAIAAQEESWKSGSGAAAFNLAFGQLRRGDVLSTLQHLSNSTRIYPEEAARIIWPARADRLWPHANFDLREAFEKLKPARTAWPKITVLTPSYNQAAYIEETLLSVLNQHYPALEYIVLDGVSSDGSIEILKRYEPRLAKLIIGQDGGQTAALNQGLRLASGELILWVNSDDMLGPGALFMVALAFLEAEADVIAGFCCEHSEHRFNLISLPAVTQATFAPETLGEIFDYWLKGHYFYQPEVAFSRRILDKVGGSLDQRLHYTMDYEFWLRCAQAGARLSVIHWPVGLFRRHAAQKTTDMDNTVIEQAQVRDRFVLPGPGFERKLKIRQRLERVFRARVPRVRVLSTRASKIFSTETDAELRERFPDLDIGFYGSGDGVNMVDSDLLISLVHLFKEPEWIRQRRDEGYDGPAVGWFWDNHHHIFDNYRAIADFDICIPGHAWAGNYLRSRENLLMDSVPLCVTQWTTREARSFFAQHKRRKRSDDLYGGFVNYQMATKRNRLVEELIGADSKGVYFINESSLTRYFKLSAREKFQSWANYKTSLCLPLNGDLSQRLFDALLTGQIPLVPPDIHDLDAVISKSLQESLPVIRFPEYSASSVIETQREAVKRFDRDGEKGAQRRHHFVLENHMFAARIATVLDLVRNLLKGC